MPLVERVAERFRVLGEPMRIRLLEAMREGEMSVKDLQEATGASQQNVSQHLGVLLRAGIVDRRKEGQLLRLLGSPTPSSSRSATRSAAGCAASSKSSTPCSREAADAPAPRWPLERVLFALAGTVVLLSVALVALVSPWFLLLTAFVGVNLWLYVLVGACPASYVLKRTCEPPLGRLSASPDDPRSGRSAGWGGYTATHFGVVA